MLKKALLKKLIKTLYEVKWGHSVSLEEIKEILDVDPKKRK